MGRFARFLCMVGGAMALILNSQVIATVMLTNGVITAVWYLKDGK